MHQLSKLRQISLQQHFCAWLVAVWLLIDFFILWHAHDITVTLLTYQVEINQIWVNFVNILSLFWPRLLWLVVSYWRTIDLIVYEHQSFQVFFAHAFFLSMVLSGAVLRNSLLQFCGSQQFVYFETNDVSFPNRNGFGVRG